MRDMVVAVFGPANGLRVLELPKCAELSHENVAISEYDFTIAQQGRLVVLKRLPTEPGAGMRVAVIVSEQVYEPHLRRLGHACGAYFEFSVTAPDPRLLLGAAYDLVRFLKTVCVKGYNFCDFDTFLDTVRTQIATRLEPLLGHLGKFGGRPRIAAPGDATERFVYRVNDLSTPGGIETVVEWFLFGLGPVSCQQIFICDARSGEAATSIRTLPSITALDATCYVANARAMQQAVDEFRPRAQKATQLQAEVEALTAQMQSLQSRHETLQQQATDLINQLSHVKRRGSDDPRRLAPALPGARGAVGSPRFNEQEPPSVEAVATRAAHAVAERVLVQIEAMHGDLVRDLSTIQKRVEMRPTASRMPEGPAAAAVPISLDSGHSDVSRNRRRKDSDSLSWSFFAGVGLAIVVVGCLLYIVAKWLGLFR